MRRGGRDVKFDSKPVVARDWARRRAASPSGRAPASPRPEAAGICTRHTVRYELDMTPVAALHLDWCQGRLYEPATSNLLTQSSSGRRVRRRGAHVGFSMMAAALVVRRARHRVEQDGDTKVVRENESLNGAATCLHEFRGRRREEKRCFTRISTTMAATRCGTRGCIRSISRAGAATGTPPANHHARRRPSWLNVQSVKAVRSTRRC